MGLFDFFKDSGEEVIEKEAAAPEKSAEELSQEAANAIRTYIENQNLNIENLKVSFVAAEGKVTLEGTALTQEASEKAALAAGNIKGISNVENNLSIAETSADESVQYHDVKGGETLSSIAKQYYGDANQYMKIFEANKPMLTNPDKIYPGQKLRIPS
ncbi:peptidoglycan-binding protein LysM [Suttonella ornithocola]|uniref:Potassium binding protein Kbp n=1 Tax=Suttonella ornithocola TaxID=279832 RepID=A0A380MNQ9_9GAMM|nr:peptidoglycan-binding protein LysM [Suttonella ornithocola]SUO93361.1 LysM domain/BON superfamily protein [Suttonella ornithocola]